MYSNILPPLSAKEYETLKEDIAANGVKVPVEYDYEGNVLDGHERVKACSELGIKDWPRVVKTELTTDAAKVEYIKAKHKERLAPPKKAKVELPKVVEPEEE